MLTTLISYQVEGIAIRLLTINQKKFQCTKTKQNKVKK